MKDLHEHLTDLRAELEEKKLELLKLRTEISARYIGIRKIKKLIARGPAAVAQEVSEPGAPVEPAAVDFALTLLAETPPAMIKAWHTDYVADCRRVGEQPLSFEAWQAKYLVRPPQGGV